MIEFELRRTMVHPPDQVVAALADAARHPEWMPGVQVVQPTDDGASWTEERVRFGRLMTEDYRVEERSLHRLVLAVEGGEDSARRGSWRFAYQAHEIPEGTELHLRGSGEGLGTVGRVAGRFLVEPFRRSVEADLEALEEWLGGATGAGD